jgi:hypothetical protein
MANPSPDEEEVVDVGVIAVNGDRYEFPRVLWKTLWPILRSDSLHGFDRLSFVNSDQACLNVPSSIIRNITVNGQIYWTKPSVH